jgi:hypothetical protein
MSDHYQAQMMFSASGANSLGIRRRKNLETCLFQGSPPYLRQPLIARYHQNLVSSQHPYLDAAAAEVVFPVGLQRGFNDMDLRALQPYR